MKAAASYARISEKKERDKVADQHEQNAAHAKARGYEIVAKFQDDGISAMGDKERPGFEAMLEAAARGDFEVIIATEEERLARNIPEKVELHSACEAYEVVWDTVRDGFTDPSTDAGEFMSIIRAAQGRIESKRKARRQVANNRELVYDGLPVPGKRRYGFEPGNIEERKDEADEVRRLYKDFLKGASIRSLSIRMGWRPVRVRETLANPCYAGWVVRRGERFEAHESVARIVKRKRWEKVQSILNAPGRRTSPGSQPRHLASGIVRCGACEAPLAYRNNYLCIADLHHPCIKKELLEKKIRDEVVNSLLYGHGDTTSPEASRLHDIDRVLTKLEYAERELAAALTGGMKWSAIAPQQKLIDAEREELNKERTDLLSRNVQAQIVADLRREIFDAVTHRVDMEKVAELKKLLGERYDALDFDHKRELIQGQLDVHLDKGRGTERIRVRHLVAVSLNESVEHDGAAA